MRFAKRWVFTAWWVLAVVGFVASSRLRLEYSSVAAAKQITFLMPAWGAPWAVPLAAIRALDVPGGVPYNFELALTLGLAGCLLLDVRHRRRAIAGPAHGLTNAE